MPTDKLQLDYLPGHLEILLSNQDYSAIDGLLHHFRVEDVAECLLQLNRDQIREILTCVQADLAGDLVKHIDDDYWGDLLNTLDQKRLLEILHYLPSDDAADLLEELDQDVRDQLLAASAESANFEAVTSLLMYPERTAGALMNPDIVMVQQDLSIDQALSLVRREIKSFKDINRIFICDQAGHLTGILPLHMLISVSPELKIETVMLKDFIAVNVLMEEEEVIEIVRKYEMTTIPVIDAQGLLTGVITIDDIMDVMEEIADEEAYRMAAMSEPDAQHSAFRSAMTRIPWLLICLGGSMSAGTIIHLFENTLEQTIVLASFMPAVMGMAGNTGVQTATLVIRNMTPGPSLRSYLLQLVLREFRAAIFIGVLCGGLAGLFAWLGFRSNPIIGGVIGLSLCLSILFSTFLGTSIPYLFQRLNVDPAVASGPFVTTINDSTALVIYLSIASFALHYVH